MPYFFLSITYILNPYLLLAFSSILKLNINRIYMGTLIPLYFVFMNLRIYGQYYGVDAADDSEDYINGSRILSSGMFSLIDILAGKADGKVNHIDKSFSIFQLFLSNIFSPEIIPLVFSISVGLLFSFSMFTIPKITNNLVKISPQLLGSLIIINPYLIYMNQTLYRQIICLGFLIAIILPFILKLFIRKEFLKIKKFDYLFLLVCLIISFGFHRGSFIPLFICTSISYLLALDFYKEIARVITTYIVKRNTLINLLIIFAIPMLIYFSGKYFSQFSNYLLFLDLRTNNLGLRTSLVGIIISIYSLYSVIKYDAFIFFKSKIKSFIIIFSLLNLILSSLSLVTNFGLARLLFSNNFFLLAITLLTININKFYLKTISLVFAISTFLNYAFVKEAFWGKGNLIFPYF